MQVPGAINFGSQYVLESLPVLPEHGCVVQNTRRVNNAPKRRQISADGVDYFSSPVRAGNIALLYNHMSSESRHSRDGFLSIHGWTIPRHQYKVTCSTVD